MPTLRETLLPKITKITKIQRRVFELQLKISGTFFIRHSVHCSETISCVVTLVGLN